MQNIERKLVLENVDLMELFGPNEYFLELIDSRFEATLIVRGDTINLRGTKEDLKKIETVINEMVYMLNKNGNLNEKDITSVLDLVDLQDKPDSKNVDSNNRIIYHGAKDKIIARNPKQVAYYEKVLKNDLLFAIGPAGTGKTFLAVAMALAALKRNEVGRIILSRPAVEAGESLGFLPGDLHEKIDPYLRPLLDALNYMVTPDKIKSLKEREIIEITPLAYMRGRTLNNAFVILDEAQNATYTQMKMFLTRLGNKSKAIITGDITQIDLPKRNMSGLVSAQNILKEIDGIGFVYFDSKDVIRHRLVAEIIKAYENNEVKKSSEAKEKE